MKKNSKIYIAGHRGMVGSALLRKIKEHGFTNIVTKSSKELDLRNQKKVLDFFQREKPDYVIIFSWHIYKQIINNIRRRGYKGKFIIPLPYPKIISKI